MHPSEAIERLSRALDVLSNEPLDKEALRTLCAGLCDSKHQLFIERGLANNDKTLILHGLVGTLSHYETEKEAETRHAANH